MKPTGMLADVQTRERLNTRVRTSTGLAVLLLITGVAGFAMVAMNNGPTSSSNVAAASVVIAAPDATNSMTVRWTAPGDDGNTGQATSYDLRYGTSAITNANWGFATAAQGVPPPKAAGQNEQLLVANLQPNTTYFFGLKTADEAGNISALSNIPTKATAPISLPGCVENWRCDDWLACTAGTQTRVCTDQAACGTTSNKPTATRACTAGGGAPPQGADSVPPNTVLTAAPTGTTSEGRYRFTWRGLDDVTPTSALEFSYRLDNRPWSGWVKRTEVVLRNMHNSNHTFQVRSRDAAKNVDPSPASASFRVFLGTLIGVGVERGGAPTVRLINLSGQTVRNFTAFESGFRGGVQVQVADLGDDGFGELVVASGPGRVAEVRLFRTDGSRITSFLPYGNAYRDGLFVTVADVNGDGPMEIITAKQKGTPNVRV
ncbi:MAG: fibronectin type III domain-containing protein, partial [Patescibacteria group bacterium]